MKQGHRIKEYQVDTIKYINPENGGELISVEMIIDDEYCEKPYGVVIFFTPEQIEHIHSVYSKMGI